MKPVRKIEKLLARFAIEVDGQQDRAVLDNLLDAQAEREKTGAALPVFDAVRMMVRSRMMQVMAATIIIGIGFWGVYKGTDIGEIASPPVLQEVGSPAEWTTLGALRLAYCRGGMELVEKMCDQAISRSGPRPAEVSRWDYFQESNNQ